MTRRSLAGIACAAAAVVSASVLEGQASLTAERQARIDAVFSTFTSATPGCAVGVSAGADVVVEKAYGLADLEQAAPNRPDTIFEAGSIAKQVTSAAILLLARDGKLSLDDPLSRHIPELPGYPTPPTIRHALTHTSGLRDWGEIAAIGGWPRGTRAHTQVHVLEIAARQRSLNFTPGTNWSYSNTGYNLAAMIVSRVAGTAFAEFCRRRLFEPLGMSRTSWRDDYGRVVKGRATAYAPDEGAFRSRMPFEDAHGNGGLLTTVGDLLRWNRRFDASGPDGALARTQQDPATLVTGEALDYGLGLYITRYNGVLEIAHGGSTAGYEAYLARYPERRLSVAVLCNVAGAGAEARARAVADVFLGTRPSPVAPRPGPAAFLDAWAGLYRSVVTGRTFRVLRRENGLEVEGGPRLIAIGQGRFAEADGPREVEFADGRAMVLRHANGLTERYERVDPARPSADALREFEGVYASEEAEVAYGAVLQKGELKLWRRPNVLISLKPTYADAFDAPGLGAIRFRREAGRIVELSIGGERVWDLRFRRIQ